jgi:hypothetical protein
MKVRPGVNSTFGLRYPLKIMTMTQFVRHGDRGFWAYDVALGVFLKHLIDVAEPLAQSQGNNWRSDELSHEVGGVSLREICVCARSKN